MTQTQAWTAAGLTTQLGRKILDSHGLQQGLQTAVEGIPTIIGVDAASITLREKDRWQTAARTHNQIVQADQLQYDLDHGPCVDAAIHRIHYVVGDVVQDARWGRWAPQAARLGLGSLLAIHIQITAKPAGSLNLYTWPPAPTTPTTSTSAISSPTRSGPLWEPSTKSTTWPPEWPDAP